MTRYTQTGRYLSPEEMADITCKIQSSEEFELDELSHVVVRGINARVAYLGDDHLDLCNFGVDVFHNYHKKIVSYAIHYLCNKS